MKVFVRVRPTLDGEIQAIRSHSEKVCSGKSTYNKQSYNMQALFQESPFSFPEICDRDLNLSSSSFSSKDLSKQLIEIKEPYKDRGGLSSRRQKWSFGFDGIYAPSHDQMDIWSGCEPMIQSAIDGYNVCIFAYGQVRMNL